MFLAAIIGGLNRYHERHGVVIDSLRMSLPINLRTAGDDAGGNRFAPARFPVPADIEDPAERVRALGVLVRNWRAEPALRMTSALAGTLNRLPTSTTTALFGGMLKCVDFVATNVPGAPVPVYTGGARIDRMYAFAPTAGRGGERLADLALRHVLRRGRRRHHGRARRGSARGLPAARLRRDARHELAKRAESAARPPLS